MGEPNEDLQYLLDLQKQKNNNNKEEEDELVQGEEKNISTSLLSNLMSPSFLSCFEQFKKL